LRRWSAQRGESQVRHLDFFAVQCISLSLVQRKHMAKHS
jgi:hypothetical protein